MRNSNHNFRTNGPVKPKRQRRIWIIIPGLMLALLACNLQSLFPSSEDNTINFRSRLPTLTATVSASAVTSPNSPGDTAAEAGAESLTATATPTTILPTSTPWPSATPRPQATGTPPPTATLPPTPDGFTVAPVSVSPGAQTTAGWSLEDVQISPDLDEGEVWLHGNLVNNTNASQELAFITGTFFDAQGQIIAEQESVIDLWPSELIPAGGRMPFQLIFDSAQNVDTYELHVEVRASNETLVDDFEFLDSYQQNSEEAYCVGGAVKNNSGQLQNYVLIMVTLYDNQNQVIGFGDYYEPEPGDLIGSQTLDFEICTAPPGRPVARYDLQAWGQ